MRRDLCRSRPNYDTAVRDSSTTYEKNNYKLVIKSKQNESTEAMKTMLKRKINPTQLKVGISSMKASRDGRLIIESGKEEGIDVLSKHIDDQCSQLLEVNIPKLRNPDIIVFNIQEDITEQNAAEIISLQNPELNLQENTLML
ncbi:hypothetical protein C0J52_23369 [Blattella germanica]|nr:hypothetical protein C0J52_23369 [Blattella germanica]